MCDTEKPEVLSREILRLLKDKEFRKEIGKNGSPDLKDKKNVNKGRIECAKLCNETEGCTGFSFQKSEEIVPITLIRKNAECKSPDTYLGNFDTLEACAEACK